MNEKSTRTNLDAASEPTRTDWERLGRLDDAQIDAAIASDPDSYAVAEDDRIGRAGAAYRYLVFMDKKSRWRWRLEGAEGEILADSHGVFSTRREAVDALASLRQAMLGAISDAA